MAGTRTDVIAGATGAAHTDRAGQQADDVRDWTRRMFYQAGNTLSETAASCQEASGLLGRIEFPSPRGFSLTLDNHRRPDEYDRIRQYCTEQGLELLPLAEVIGSTQPYTANTYAVGLRSIPDDKIPQTIPEIIAAYRAIDDITWENKQLQEK
jgi:hypothetical protein